MQRSKSALCAVTLVAAGAVALVAHGKPIEAKRMIRHHRSMPMVVDFALINAAIGVGQTPTTADR